MIRVYRPYAECRICEAYKPVLVTTKARTNGEISDQYVNIECGNSWMCMQIRKAIRRTGTEEAEKEEAT